MAESSAEALARRLYTALEIGDAAAVRRALADGADPERGPAEEFGTRPLMQLLVNMEIANQMNKHPDAPDWEKRYHKPGADPVACCAALLDAAYVIPAAVGRSTSHMCRKSKRPAASDRTRR